MPGPLTILIVDDDASILLMCRNALARDGVVILQAIGSSEALKLVTDHRAPINLIVTDIMLPPPAFQITTSDNPFPRVNGPELVNLLLNNGRELRVVYISASSKQHLQTHGIKLGDAPFLQKPLTPQALNDAVQEALAGPPAAKQLKKADQASPQVDWFG
jgi:CheY-like chemotaxis protein